MLRLVLIINLFFIPSGLYSQISEKATIVGKWKLINVMKTSRNNRAFLDPGLDAERKYNGVLHFTKQGFLERDSTIEEIAAIGWRRHDTILTLGFSSLRPKGFKGYVPQKRWEEKVTIKKLSSKELILLYTTEEALEYRQFLRIGSGK